MSEAELREKITEWVVDNLYEEDIDGAEFDGEADILEYMDSIVLLELLTFCEDEFNAEFPPDEVMPENFQSVNRIVSLVQRCLV